MATVQGATEFLPVSSSGHILLLSWLLRANLGLETVIVLHAASLLAVVLFVHRTLFEVLKNWKLLINLIISTLPAALVGIFFEDHVEKAFSNVALLPIFFSITALTLLIASLKNGDKNLQQMKIHHAFLIGLFQAIAVFPGISRSGMALSAALILGFKREDAINYAFLMAIPVLAGAFVLKLNSASMLFHVSGVASFLASLMALFILKRTVLVGKLKAFSAYCLALAFFTFVVG